MYFPAWGRWFWYFLGGESVSVVGLIFVNGVPAWIWQVIILAGFVVGPIAAFHALRFKLDAAVAETKQRADSAEARLAILEQNRTRRDVLGCFFSQLEAIFHEKPTVEVLADWQKRKNDLVATVMQYIEQTAGAGVAVTMRPIAPILLQHSQRCNDEHNMDLNQLRVFCENLRAMIRATGKI